MKRLQGFDIWVRDFDDADEVMPTRHFDPPVLVDVSTSEVEDEDVLVRVHLPIASGTRLFKIADLEVTSMGVQWDRWFFADGPESWGEPILIHHIAFDDEPCQICEFEILGGVTIPDWVLLSLLKQLGVEPEVSVE